MPVVEVGQIFEFNYTGDYQYWIPENDCKIKMEVYGAEGGCNGSSTGGKGGYATGEINIKAHTELFVFVGEQPNSHIGGFNGGGNSLEGDNGEQGGGGGGSSDVRIGSISEFARVIVAGGGGGSNSDIYVGGYGGGVAGSQGSSPSSNSYAGKGGTQSAGGISRNNTTIGNGKFLIGGNSETTPTNDTNEARFRPGGGGGGWYGGAGGYLSYAGGGGGSGYTHTSSSYKPKGYLLTSEYYLMKESMIPSVRSGNGYVKFTILQATPIKVKSIELLDHPKMNYRINESFVDEGTIEISYNNGTKSIKPISLDMLTGFDTSTIGNKSVTITYDEFDIEYNISVIEVSSMIFREEPIKIYFRNDSFIDKGSLMIKWSDNKSEIVNITSDMITGFDTSTVGVKTLTITYYNAEITYDIKVTDIVSISIYDQPFKEYKLNESFKNGGTIEVNFEDGRNEIVDITSNMVTDFDTSKIGYSIVTLSYEMYNIRYHIMVLLDEMVCIYDRTLEDVDYAYENQNLVSKGALNYEDLNRIETNMEAVVSSISTIGYYLNLDIKTDWIESDIPTYLEMNRIRYNIKKLIIKFVEIGVLPPIDELYYLNYVEVNNWESIICQLFSLYNKYLKDILYCGTRYCGE